MRVRLSIDVDERDRYVIAKYFGDGVRATRLQVRQFTTGAVRSAVRANADALRGRQRSVARRLEAADGSDLVDELTPPREHQLNLLDGAK